MERTLAFLRTTLVTASAIKIEETQRTERPLGRLYLFLIDVAFPQQNRSLNQPPQIVVSVCEFSISPWLAMSDQMLVAEKSAMRAIGAKSPKAFLRILWFLSDPRNS